MKLIQVREVFAHLVLTIIFRSHAFVITNSALRVLDISDINNITLVGSWADTCQYIDVHGNNAYVCSNSEIIVFDIQNKSNPVVLGTQAIYITDADQLSGTSFVEVDVSDVATGTSSTSFQLGTNSDNFEFIYLEKDDENIQFVIGINFDNDSKEDEIQFRLEFDETGTGTSYIGTANSTISAQQAKDGRTASATLPFIKRMKYGDLVKLTYRYVDNTNTTVQSMIWTAK